jgi:predicted transcriptional regulator
MRSQVPTAHQPGPNRLRALELLEQGLTVREIARLLDLSTARIYQFIAMEKEKAS